MSSIKTYNPTSPAIRFRTTLDNKDLSTDRPLKRLTESKQRISGRNNKGRLTVRHRGGGHKKLYRIIDFRRDKREIPAKVVALEYDPEPLGAHCIACVCGRRETLHPGSRRAGRWGYCSCRRCRGHSCRQFVASEEHPSRHDDSQHRDEAG